MLARKQCLYMSVGGGLSINSLRPSLYTITAAISRGFIINITRVAGEPPVSTAMPRISHYGYTQYTDCNNSGTSPTETARLIVTPISLLFIQHFDAWPQPLYGNFSGAVGTRNSLRRNEHSADCACPSQISKLNMLLRYFRHKISSIQKKTPWSESASEVSANFCG
jgi:hypothetical protein